MKKRPNRLLDQAHDAIRRKHYYFRTGEAYVPGSGAIFCFTTNIAQTKQKPDAKTRQALQFGAHRLPKFRRLRKFAVSQCGYPFLAPRTSSTAAAMCFAVRPYSSNSSSGVPDWPKRSWMPIKRIGTACVCTTASATALPKPPIT